MNNRRIQLLLLALELLGLLLLTQTWFSVRMDLNGTKTNLGEFDAIATYAIAMPASLLCAAAVLTGFLVSGLAKRMILGFAATIRAIVTLWLALQVTGQNIAGLDIQLDRLTGIAKTHGIKELSVATGLAPWLWLAVSALGVVVAGYLAIRPWPLALEGKQRKGVPRQVASTIDLWEQQRD